MRKKKKDKFKKEYLVIPAVGFVLFFGVSFYLNNKKTEKVLVDSKVETTENNPETVYPQQYGDRNITVNAKISDERFRNLSYFDKDSLLSNAISFWLKSDEVLTSTGLEKGTWLWTPIMQITPSYRDSIISGAKKNSINTIYLSIDSYLDIFAMQEGSEKEKAKSDFNAIVKDFIKTANENDIEVDAEAGWQNWSEEGHLYKPGAILDYVISFNKNNAEKFHGFQYDVEVYLLPEYKKDKEKILENFVSLINQTVTKISGTDLYFSVVIPEFYDENSNKTPNFKYKGEKKNVVEHLLTVLERRQGSKIIVMSYRNKSGGRDGSIDVSKDEISLANKYNTKVVIAQETGDVPPPYITFYNTSRKQYDTQVALLEKAFVNEKSFGGIAVHYINAFLELK